MRDERSARVGGAAAWVAALLLILAGGALYVPGMLSLASGFVALVAGILALSLMTLLARYLLRDAEWLRSDAAILTLAALAGLLLFRGEFVRWPSQLFPWILLAGLGGPLLFGWGFGKVFGRGRGRGGWLLMTGGLALLAGGVSWLLWSGPRPFPREPLDFNAVSTALDVDPGAPGDHPVESLFYGSGTDRRRPEFGPEVDIVTGPVDLGPVLPEWTGFRAAHREWWWGFGISEAPINGRMQLPRGAPGDRRPVALLVHGNHGMEDFSDDGYGYLTGMLASHGIVGVSVDANFLNGTWSGDFRGREMPARGVLLLEHLAALREMDRDPDSPLHQRLDLDRVALVGHSRGGEAAAIAAVFNDLDHFPDRAEVEFDYRFGIRSVVAIAQIDARYPRRMTLEDTHFLALHGSHDTDEPSFHGLRQYHRARFSGRPLEGAIPFGVKAGILLHGGNHGQFNSTWGMDSGLPGSLWLNRAPLVSEETQRQVARSYIAAFLRATLLGETRWLPLLRDYRAGERFLPDIPYLNQYADGRTDLFATFEEDLDVGTGAAPWTRIHAEGFSRWREEEMMFRDGSRQATSAVRLRIGADPETPPVYEIRFLDQPSVGGEDELVFALTWIPDRAGDGGGPLSLEVELVQGLCPPEAECADAAFRPVAVPSPEPAFEVRFLKSGRMDRARYRNSIEPIPQAHAIPVRDLTGTTAAASVRAVRFAFQGTPPGDVLLDDIGWRRAPPPESP